MRLIDAHVHVLDNYAPMAPFEDAGRHDRLLKLMDECGVEKALMLPVVAPFSPRNNEECAAWARQHPDRLAAMTDVPLDQPDAAARIRRAREEFGAVAVSCYPAKSPLDWMLEPACEPVWQAFADTGLVSNLHVTPPGYEAFFATARRYPQVRFVLNHFGLIGRADPTDPQCGGLFEAASLPNVFVKASAFYSVAATAWDFRCPQALGVFSRVLKGLGPEKLLWGTDWPPSSRGLTYRQCLEIVRTFAGLGEKDLELILGGNAARVFGV
jgi:L-fuconolactonase